MELGDLEVLLAVAQGGSLSAAAKRYGIAVSTAARRIASLETALHLRLVERRADGARLTPDGARIAALAAPLGDQLATIARAAEALRGGDGALRVRVSAVESVIADVLAPAVPKLWAKHPGIVLQLQSSFATVSLAGGDAELAIRMARPTGASLLAKRLPDARLGLFVARRWLAGRDPADIHPGDGPLLAYDDSFGRLPELAWLDRVGLTHAVRLACGSTRALLTACAAGAGIGLLPTLYIRPEHDLVELPVAEPPPLRTPWLIAHRDVRRLPAVATVHRWIVAAFAAMPLG